MICLSLNWEDKNHENILDISLTENISILWILVNQMTWFKPLFYTIFFFKRICISYCSRKIEMHFSWIVIIPVLIVEQPQEEEHECTVYMCNSYMLVSQCIYMPFKLSRVNPVVIALATISFYLWLSLILYSSLGFIYNVWGFFWNF